MPMLEKYDAVLVDDPDGQIAGLTHVRDS